MIKLFMLAISALILQACPAPSSSTDTSVLDPGGSSGGSSGGGGSSSQLASFPSDVYGRDFQTCENTSATTSTYHQTQIALYSVGANPSELGTVFELNKFYDAQNCTGNIVFIKNLMSDFNQASIAPGVAYLNRTNFATLYSFSRASDVAAANSANLCGHTNWMVNGSILCNSADGNPAPHDIIYTSYFAEFDSSNNLYLSPALADSTYNGTTSALRPTTQDTSLSMLVMP